MLPTSFRSFSSKILCTGLFVMPLGSLEAQGHHHPHHHGHDHSHGTSADPVEGLLSIEQVLAMEQNRGVATSVATHSHVMGSSGDGDLKFEIIATNKDLPKKVFEVNPFAKKRKILDCAHGGFAYDYREGRGEVYWFLQGGGMMRVNKDRTKIGLVKTDPKMLRFNMHNATFFVHKGEGRIAWPANSGASVFITDTNGKLLHTIGRPTVPPYSTSRTGYAPTDTAYLDGLLWVTDGYASKFVMSYDLDAEKWTGTIFGGKTRKPEPGKFGTNHGITIHKGLIYVSGRFFARIHSYKPDTKFVKMFPLPKGSKPCDFEFFTQGDRLYGVAASLNKAAGSKDKGAAIYIVDMETLKIVSTIKPKDELGLGRFTHLHNVFASVDDGKVTLFCQAWNIGDFAVLRQVTKAAKTDKIK